MTPLPSTSIVIPRPSDPIAPSTLKPQLYMNGQMTYPPFGAFTYGQWATGMTAYGAAVQSPYPPSGTATTMPQRQPYGQLSYAQIYGQSQAPPRGNQAEIRSSLSTAAKTDTSPQNSAPSHAILDPPQPSVSLQGNEPTEPNAALSGSEAQDAQTAQLAEILRTNPQLANMLLAAMVQAQPPP
jgi:hypothetical protein